VAAACGLYNLMDLIFSLERVQQLLCQAGRADMTPALSTAHLCPSAGREPRPALPGPRCLSLFTMVHLLC
jgi:hypothetical protein